MRTIISPNLLYLANRVSKIPFLKGILRPFYYSYKSIIQYNRNKLFLDKGLSVLKEFDQVMIDNNIPYSIFAGTLLGAIREHDFLKHDLDIDTVIFYCDYTKNQRVILEKAGFKLHHSFRVEDGKIAMEETYEKYGVSIDIYYVYSDEQFSTYQCDFHPLDGTITWEKSMEKYGYVQVRRLEFPVKHEFVRIPFAGIEVNAISNAEEWLAARYGDDYMIPNPLFCDKGDNNNIFNWNSVRAIYKCEK